MQTKACILVNLETIPACFGVLNNGEGNVLQKDYNGGLNPAGGDTKRVMDHLMLLFGHLVGLKARAFDLVVVTCKDNFVLTGCSAGVRFDADETFQEGGY